MSDARVEELIEGFEFLDSWDDRFRYIIDLGRTLPPMDGAMKHDETKVDRCTRQAWMVASAAGSPRRAPAPSVTKSRTAAGCGPHGQAVSGPASRP